MIPNQIWTEIEGPLFAATIGVVSTPRAYRDALKMQRVVTVLAALLSSHDNQTALIARLTHLLTQSTDIRYCHPHDLAIGTYLATLANFSIALATEPARLASSIPNLWWGKLIAAEILAPRTESTSVVQITSGTPYAILGVNALTSMVVLSAHKPAPQSNVGTEQTADATSSTADISSFTPLWRRTLTGATIH